MNEDDVIEDIKGKMMDSKSRCYSDPALRRPIRRPEEILRDVRGLKLRQRVSLVLGDEILREELEDTVRNSTSENGIRNLNGTIRTYQDFLLPTFQPSICNIGGGGGGSAVFPINDIRGESTTLYSKKEKYLRCKLASVYRLVDLKGWSMSIFNHISVRVPDDDSSGAYLVNPFGLMYSEVTASSLIKCDISGESITGGSTCLGVNKAGFCLHSCIHEARPDINCIIHVHTPSVIAVSSMKCGFLRISQESLLVGEVSYHDYWGVLINDEERQSIKDDLGPTNMVLFLRNHGVAVCGKSIEEAYMLLENIMQACETQVKLAAFGLDNIHIVSDEAYQQVREYVKNSEVIVKSNNAKPKVSVEEYYFEGYMRWLDSQGYRTGFMYRIPEIFISEKHQGQKKVPESRIPPQVTSDRELQPHQLYYQYQNQYDTPRKGPTVGRGNTHRNRFQWLNSPVQGTQYLKEEIKEDVKNEKAEETLVNGFHHEDTIKENGVHTKEAKNESQVEVQKVKQADGTTIITQTTTVKKTTLITEEVKVNDNVKKSEVSAGETLLNGHDKEILKKVIEKEDATKKIVSPSKSINSENSSGGTGNELTSSPQKVKKSKSFKAAFKKKVKKKEEKEKK